MLDQECKCLSPPIRRKDINTEKRTPFCKKTESGCMPHSGLLHGRGMWVWMAHKEKKT